MLHMHMIEVLKTKRDDPKSSLLLWFSHPPIMGVARTGSISCRILHLFCGSRSEERGVLHGDESEAP